MICSTSNGCGYEFCWLCLDDWKNHDDGTGEYFECNINDED